MKPEEEIYDKLIKMLRKSPPELEGTKEIENEVIFRIQQAGRRETRPVNLLDYLFGWVYIGWVRTSLVTASVFLIAFFVYQQGMILSRINALSDQPVVSENRLMTGLKGSLEGRKLFNVLSWRKIKTTSNTVTDKQIDDFIRSIDDLQYKYRDLIRLINEDPELKKEIDKRISDKHKVKFNL